MYNIGRDDSRHDGQGSTGTATLPALIARLVDTKANILYALVCMSGTILYL